MDTLTHIVLGACIGEAFIGKKAGKRAWLLGAVANSIPDIDFVASFFLSPTSDLLAHRGFTHSILFAVLMTPLLAWLADKWRRPHNITFRTWCWFFGVEMGVHLFIDVFNAYGTGLLIPFSSKRFSLHAMFVADPLFTIVPLVISIALLFIKQPFTRKRWAAVAIIWCSLYLLIDLVNKSIVEHAVKQIAQQQHLVYGRHFTTPTPLNNWLWFVVLEDDKGYHIGYRSVFDSKLQMDRVWVAKNDSLLNPIKDVDEVKNLVRYSQGYYTVERVNGSLQFNDLRFGQIIGWNNLHAGFVFHYFLQKPDSNTLVVQRGRFANWNRAAFVSMWKRIEGN